MSRMTWTPLDDSLCQLGESPFWHPHERALYWLGVGAQPTEQVAALLKLTGDWGKFKGEGNTESVVKVAEPKQAFVADTSKKAVLKPKSEKTAPAAAPADDAAETTEV